MILKGKTVLVVGVGDGLGNEVAQCAFRDGANVFMAARTEATLKKAAAELDPLGARVAFGVTDISDAAQCEAAVSSAQQRFGSVDAVVLVAAYEGAFGNIGDADLDKWRMSWETNVLGAISLVRAASSAMKEQKGGSIVLIGSQSMYKPTLPQAGYAASKGGLLSAMYYLADELGTDNIRVNMVVPSWMWGPPVQGLVKHRAKEEGRSEEAVLEDIVRDFPLRRMAEDGEVAEAAVFLASDRASAITGQSLMVNSGEIMR